MTGQEAIELIHQRAWTGRKPGLERTQALLASLGNPERRLRFVHITGTNGKGSTAAMTASILAQAGLRAGLFTSPHLYRFHERMQVNGHPSRMKSWAASPSRCWRWRRGCPIPPPSSS